MGRTKKRGFTLIELTIALAIASVLMASALPNMRALIQENSVATETSELIAALYFARTEAIRRKETVTVCPSLDLRECLASATVADWKKGWIVRASSGVLHSRSNLQHDISFTADSPTEIVYAPNGVSSLTTTRSLSLCVQQGTQGRKIKISATGRPRGDRFSCEVST